MITWSWSGVRGGLLKALRPFATISQQSSRAATPASQASGCLVFASMIPQHPTAKVAAQYSHAGTRIKDARNCFTSGLYAPEPAKVRRNRTLCGVSQREAP